MTRNGYSSKLGGIKAARKDFSRIAFAKNVETFYDFGRGWRNDLGQKIKVGDKVVLFYPKYSTDVPFPVIRMIEVTPSFENQELMVVYKPGN